MLCFPFLQPLYWAQILIVASMVGLVLRNLTEGEELAKPGGRAL
jgi:hypothetical protein